MIEVTERLKKRLRSNGVTRAAIIDDAFDPPSIDDHTRLEFWTIVSDDANLMGELKALSPEIQDEFGVDDLLINKLWSLRNETGSIYDACRQTMFAIPLQRLALLDQLCECLNSVGIEEVLRLGVNDEMASCCPPLIFLDFHLDDTVLPLPGDQSYTTDGKKDIVQKVAGKAIQKAEEVWRNAGKCKPFLVLISDRPQAGVLKEDFLVESGVLGGLFGFIPKPDFVDNNKVIHRLISWGIGDENYQQIQRFASAAIDSVETVAREFRSLIRSFDVQDYYHMQRIALSKEGQPLGDYMLWLFESLLAYSFRDNAALREQQRAMDRLDMSEPVIVHDAVRPLLAKAYRCAQTLPADRVRPHPLGDLGSPPILAMGDVFARDAKSPVYVLINAPCDLRFVLGNDSTRKWKRELSLLLIPGDFRSFDKQIPDASSIVTDLFEYKGNAYQIHWRVKEAITLPFRQAFGKVLSTDYQRITRLRPLHVLSIKTEFVSELQRLGVPVTPPITVTKDLRVHLKQGNTHVVDSPELSNACIILYHKNAVHFRFSLEAVEKLILLRQKQQTLECERLTKLINELDKAHPHYSGKREKYAHQLSMSLGGDINRETWLALTREPKELPCRNKNIIIIDKEVGLFFGKSTTLPSTNLVLEVLALDNNWVNQ